MEREIRADVFTSCRVYPPAEEATASLEVDQICPDSPSNATRTGPDIAIIVVDLMHRVLLDLCYVCFLSRV